MLKMSRTNNSVGTCFCINDGKELFKKRESTFGGYEGILFRKSNSFGQYYFVLSCIGDYVSVEYEDEMYNVKLGIGDILFFPKNPYVYKIMGRDEEKRSKKPIYISEGRAYILGNNGEPSSYIEIINISGSTLMNKKNIKSVDNFIYRVAKDILRLFDEFTENLQNDSEETGSISYFNFSIPISSGYISRAIVKLGDRFYENFPSLKNVKFTNSGNISETLISGSTMLAA